MKVIHVGAYPPPYGGITSHIKRLDAVCREQRITSIVIDTYGDEPKEISSDANVVALRGPRIQKLIKLAGLLKRESGGIVHFHLSALSNFIWGAPLLLYATRDSKRVVTLHSGSFVGFCESLPPFMQAYVHSIFRRFNHVLAANPDQRDYLVTRMEVPSQCISVIPAFLPSVPRLPDQAWSLLSGALHAFCRQFAHIALITGFAKPYYGFHNAIQAVDLLADPTVGLVVHFYTSTDKVYKQRICDLAKARRNVYISGEASDVQMAALLNVIRIFIRGTSVDGDSVALREAAYWGRQIVATDCVRRPDGCLLYPFDDPQALSKRLRQAISNKTAGIVKNPGVGNGQRILQVYRELFL